MLLNLKIKNFALIDDIDIDLSSGINCLVGETGAGKSIIISALSLLVGGRSDFEKIKNENEKAFIEGTFLITKQEIKNNSLIEDYIEEDGILVCSRTLSANKVSISKINNRNVPISVIKQLLENLVDIYSQHDGMKLLNEKNHILFLDEYIEKTKKGFKNDFEHAYDEYKDALNSLNDFKNFEKEAHDRDYIEFQIKQIEKLAIEDNEIEELEEKSQEIDELTDIQVAFDEIKKVYEDPAFSNSLNLLNSSIRSLKDKAQFVELANNYEENYERYNEAIDDLYRKFNEYNINEEEIDKINNRLYELQDVRKKFGKSTKEIIDCLNNFKQKLSAIDNYEYELKEIEKKVNSLQVKANEEAKKLNSIRTNFGEKISRELEMEFEDLGLKGGEFKVGIESKPLARDGVDNISFLISLNNKGKFEKLYNTISGGENSRLMLALKLVFNKIAPAGLIVFDEIDTGISGEIAHRVGMKIKLMGTYSQILLISHLPQVISVSSTYFLVSKVNTGKTNKTEIKILDSNESIMQLAKTMSGEKVTEATLTAAKELIKQSK